MLWFSMFQNRLRSDHMKRPKRCAGLLTVFLVVFCRTSSVFATVDYFVEVYSTDPARRAYLGYMDDPHLKRGRENLTKGDPKYFKYSLNEAKYVLDRCPNHPRGLQMMGIVARVLRRPELAIVRYEKALKMYPQYAYTHGQYGLYLISIGQSGRGIARLKKAIQMEPKSMSIYKMLAQAYMKTGNPAKAREVLETGRRTASQPAKTDSHIPTEAESLTEGSLGTGGEQPQGLNSESRDGERNIQ